MIKLVTEQLGMSIGGKIISEDLNLNLLPGQVWGVLGRNGTGKTTLLHTLAGLRPAHSGRIMLNGKDITGLSRKAVAQKLGLLMQHTEDAFPASVLETVLSGRHPHIAHWQWESKEDIALAKQALQQVGLADFAQRQINQLSGGERQRVAIATLLTQAPQIFLLDEPNSHLDLHHQIKLLGEVCQLAKSRQCIIFMSLHDINLAARFCDHLLFLFDNKKTQSGEADELLNSHYLSELYQHPMLEVTTGKDRLFIPE